MTAAAAPPFNVVAASAGGARFRARHGGHTRLADPCCDDRYRGPRGVPARVSGALVAVAGGRRARRRGGYRALCPDLRGAGWTQATSARVERLTRLRDLLALFDALEIDRAHLVSHDMGAITAMQMSYEHPERVRRHVQLSVPPAFLAMRPRLAPGFRHLPRFIWHRPGRSLRGIFAAPYLAHPLTAEEIDAHLAAMARPEIDAAVQPLTRRMILPEAMRLARGGHYRRRRLTVPTRTVFGRRDWPWSEEAMRVCCPHPEKYADEYDFAISRTRRTSSPTTNRPRLPMWCSTGSTGPMRERRADAVGQASCPGCARSLIGGAPAGVRPGSGQAFDHHRHALAATDTPGQAGPEDGVVIDDQWVDHVGTGSTCSGPPARNSSVRASPSPTTTRVAASTSTSELYASVACAGVTSRSAARKPVK